jgi:hypothetical protein
MIVAVTGIVMLVVRLGLFPGTALLAALRVAICLIQTRHEEGGEQET